MNVQPPVNSVRRFISNSHRSRRAGRAVATARRIGAESSETRARLLDVTEQIMREQGYAAVGSRTVAETAGVTPPAVHYYFPTLDDLFIAVFRRLTERSQERLVEALQETEQPLWLIWRYGLERDAAALMGELLSLANHRKAIQSEIAEFVERQRNTQLNVISDVLREYALDPDEFPPDGLLLIMMAIPRAIAIEEALGIGAGHGGAITIVERYLTRLEGPPGKPRRRRSRPRSKK
jgi:AcrR family transcriptional regulator